jgi:cathepsin D
VFNDQASSTFKNLSQPFQIQYGSGAASGSLVEDVVQMAGFSVPNQVFGAVTRVTSGLLNAPVSGLLGLAWQSIASSGHTPFWETLVTSGAWTDPVMAFQLTRFVNATTVNSEEPGGSFTMGMRWSRRDVCSITLMNAC